MFDWNNRNFKDVYRVQVVFLFLLFVLLLGSFGVAAYLSLLGPSIIPLGGYFYLLIYSFGFRLAYLTKETVLATYLLFDLPTMLLMAVFVASWVLIVILFWVWDPRLLSFLKSMKDTKGFERYVDAKALIRSFKDRGAEGRTGIIIGMVLAILTFIFSTAVLLSGIMRYSSDVGAIMVLLMSFACLLYAVNWLTVRKRFASFVRQKTGNI
ncbi:MAG: hypothetical protein QW261_16705 [Candidatus Jordarchaeaceae archaeon]